MAEHIRKIPEFLDDGAKALYFTRGNMRSSHLLRRLVMMKLLLTRARVGYMRTNTPKAATADEMMNILEELL